MLPDLVSLAESALRDLDLLVYRQWDAVGPALTALIPDALLGYRP